MHRKGKIVYCKCQECVGCGCGRWRRHHSAERYLIPNKLRKFDDTRAAIESLWSSIVKGVRAGWKVNVDAMK